MMIARWNIEARFGQKGQALDLLKRWRDDIGPQVGCAGDRCRIATGSIGALESTIELEIRVEDLSELDRIFSAMGELAAQGEWSREIEPVVVSGTPRWQIYREA